MSRVFTEEVLYFIWPVVLPNTAYGNKSDMLLWAWYLHMTLQNTSLLHILMVWAYQIYKLAPYLYDCVTMIILNIGIMLHVCTAIWYWIAYVACKLWRNMHLFFISKDHNAVIHVVPRWCGHTIKWVIFKLISMIYILACLWNCSEMNSTRPHGWFVNLGSVNVCVPVMSTQIT